MSNRRKTRYRNPCLDCGESTYRDNQPSEWYMVHDDIWAQSGAPTRDVMYDHTQGYYLCIGCLEHRIGRQLTAADFPDYPVNQVRSYNTARLNHRLTAVE